MSEGWVDSFPNFNRTAAAMVQLLVVMLLLVRALGNQFKELNGAVSQFVWKKCTLKRGKIRRVLISESKRKKRKHCANSRYARLNCGGRPPPPRRTGGQGRTRRASPSLALAASPEPSRLRISHSDESDRDTGRGTVNGPSDSGPGPAGDSEASLAG